MTANELFQKLFFIKMLIQKNIYNNIITVAFFCYPKSLQVHPPLLISLYLFDETCVSMVLMVHSVITF